MRSRILLSSLLLSVILGASVFGNEFRCENASLKFSTIAEATSVSTLIDLLEEGRTIATLMVTKRDVDPNVATIDNVRVDPYRRRLGLSSDMIRAYFKRHPEVDEVHATLMWTNYDVAVVGYSYEQLYDPVVLYRAVGRSPLARSLARLGFDDIEWAELVGRSIDVIWRRRE